MANQDFDIATKMFGGYSKKDTDAYLQKLCQMVKDTDAELERTKIKKLELDKKLDEAQECYSALWEKSKEQEDELKQQASTLESKEAIIKEQQKTIRLLLQQNKENAALKMGAYIKKGISDLKSRIKKGGDTE